MARYYAEIEGNRGAATRMGTAKSGMDSHTRGWDLGIKVWCRPDPKNPEQDLVCIGLTGGSNDPHVRKDLGTFTVADLDS